MNTNCSHEGFPMNLSFTYANYSYSIFYYGRPAVSADDAIDNDKGRSPSNGATFGSVGGRTTFG